MRLIFSRFVSEQAAQVDRYAGVGRCNHGRQNYVVIWNVVGVHH